MPACPADGCTGAEPGVADTGAGLGGAAGVAAAETAGRRSAPYEGSGPAGEGAAGAAGAGAATNDWGGVSGAGACWAGGESNTGVWAAAPGTADGVVGAACETCGSVGDIGAGGIALAAAENGSPACIPLSKLCINSDGVMDGVALAGAGGEPGIGDTFAEGGAPTLTGDSPVAGTGAPWTPTPGRGDDVGAGGGREACPWGMPATWVKFIGEPRRGVGCADGDCSAGTTALSVKAREPWGGICGAGACCTGARPAGD